MAVDKVKVIIDLDDNASAGLSRLSGALNNVAPASQRAQSSFSKLGSRIIVMNQAVQLASSIWRGLDATLGKIVRTTDQFRRTTILLTNLTGSLKQAEESLSFLVDLARKTPQTLLTLQKSFVRMKATGVEDTERAITVLADAVSAFGGTDQDLQLATLAFQQMAGKGVVSMEELRRQLGERIPTAIKILARELDLTTAQLFKKVESGTLESTKAIAALIDGLEKDYSGSAKKMLDTWTGATSVLQDVWDRALKTIDERIGLSDFGIALAQKLAIALDNIIAAFEPERLTDKLEGLRLELSNAENKLTDLSVFISKIMCKLSLGLSVCLVIKKNDLDSQL